METIAGVGSAGGTRASAAERLFDGPGEMRALCRGRDWAATPLGPVEEWPSRLQAAVEICLGSAFPTFVWWGPELLQLYNDAALAIVRAKHPSCFAASARRVWADVWDVVGPLTDHVFTTGQPAQGEDLELLMSRGGPPEAAWFTFSYGAVRDETGAVAGAFVTAIETTERVRAARRLAEVATLAGLSADFRALFEAAPSPFLVVSPPDFAIVAVNDAYLRATMTERSAIVGRALFDVFPDNPDDPTATGVANLRDSLERVIATRRADAMPVQQYDIRRPSAAGGGFEERWWSSINTPVLTAGGDVAAIIHRVEDVTEIVRLRSTSEAQDRLTRDQAALIDRLREANEATAKAMERFRESEARYRALAELSPDAAWVNLDGRFVYANRAAARVMGARSPEDLIGLRALDVVEPEYRETIRERIERMATEGGDAAPVETRWRRLDGTVIDVESTASAIPWDGRAAIQVVFRDVSDRKRAEEAAERWRTEREREARRRQLAAAEEEERRRLARELHDEVGQHLTSLGLGLQALSDVAPPGSEVDRRAAQLRALVSNLGGELHALAVRLRPKALDDFGLEAALASYAEEWSSRSGIPVDVHADVQGERLPAAVEIAVYRIVQEALTNVARHSGTTRAGVVVERRDGFVVAVVDDSGRGFDTEAVAEARDGAPRLGLLGIRERAAMLGGTVDIESTPGGGTTLFVRIPIDAAGRG